MRNGLIGCVLAVLFLGSANAAPGDLDTSFGQGGLAFVGDPAGAEGDAIAIQSDGKIVVAGTDVFLGRIIVARFNADGSLDTTFGNLGKVTTAFDVVNTVTAVAIQSNGKIVVAGSAYASNERDPLTGELFPPISVAVARFTATGALDSTFGSGGKVTASIGHNASVGGMAIQSGGQILVVGSIQNFSSPSCVFSFFLTSCLEFLLIRFDSTGRLDTSFGTTGTRPLPNLAGAVTTNFGGQAKAFAVALQGDGKIVVAGCMMILDLQTTVGEAAGLFAVARYSANGLLDSTFGILGRVTTQFTTHNDGCLVTKSGDTALGIAVQADGKILVVGYEQNLSPCPPSCISTIPALVRYNTDGTPDTSFGSGGKVTTPFSFGAQATAVVIQPDGKIVVSVAGAMARYRTNGLLDTTFGNGGKVEFPLNTSTGTFFGGAALAIQKKSLSEGEIVLAGEGLSFTTRVSRSCVIESPVLTVDDCMAVARVDAFLTTLTKTGTFALAPAESVQTVNQPFLYSFTWTVPDPESWQDLTTLELRVRDGPDSIIQVIYDVVTNRFSLLHQATGRPGPSVAPGSHQVLSATEATLHMTNTNVVAAGPTSPTVTLNLSVELKPQTAGRTFLVEVAADDVLGNSTGFVPAGTLTVSGRY